MEIGDNEERSIRRVLLDRMRRERSLINAVELACAGLTEFVCPIALKILGLCLLEYASVKIRFVGKGFLDAAGPPFHGFPGLVHLVGCAVAGVPHRLR